MAFNRELSQFANYLELDAGANYIGIATNTNDANVGIGSATPESKLTVTGDAKISGVVTATSFDGALVGNADSASVLETARTISLSGDLGGSVSFDGSQDITITATVQPDSVDLGTDTVGNYVRELQAVGGSGIAVIDGTGEGTIAQVELTDTGVAPGTTGSSTEIPVITVDSKGRITSVSTTDVGTTLAVEGDSGSASIDLLTETVKFAGGANITSTVAPGSGGTVTYQSNATEFGSAAAGLGTRVFTAGQSDTIFNGADGGFSFDPLYITEGQDLRLKFGAVNNPNYNLRVRLNKDDTLLHSSNFSNFNNFDLTTAIPSERYPLALTDIEIIALSDASSASVVVIEISIDGSVISNGSTVSVPATSDVVSYALDSDISLNTVTATEFNTGAVGSAIRVSSDTISGPATLTLDPAGVGDNTGKVVIAGDLQVDGTQTIVNSTTITVDDKNISLADGATNDAEADGGGITIQSGEGDKTFQFEANGDNFGSSENMNLADGKTYKIDNVDILSQTALGDSVVESSLTSVGNLEQLNVLGIVTASTFVATSGTFDLTGNVTGNLDGIAENASGILTARDFTISGDATAPAVSFDGRQNVDLNLTLADTGVVSSAYGSSVKIPRIVVDSKGRITGVTELTGDLLEKVGGELSGNLTIAGDAPYTPEEVEIGSFAQAYTGLFSGNNWFSVRAWESDSVTGAGLSFNPITVTTSMTIPGTLSVAHTNPAELVLNQGEADEFAITPATGAQSGFDFVAEGLPLPYVLKSIIFRGGASGTASSIQGIQIDGVSINAITTQPATTITLGVDGTASFVGNVTAATAPTADEHLTNKAYVDGLDSANSADIAANTAAIAAETAARTAADNTLTTNLAAEEAARIAADATKLPLAGGLMTGAIELGTAPPPPGGSVAFDASDSRVTTIVEDSNRLTTMNFTTEVFIRVDALPEPGEQFMIYSQPNFGFNIKNDGGQMKMSYGMSGLGFGSSGSAGFGFTIVPGTWHHYAIVRNGADVKVFFDGEQALSLSAMSGRPLTINNGDVITLGGGTNGFSGIHYSNARIVVDESVYTNTFTPPTAEFAVSDYAGTGLLAFQHSTSAAEEATGKTLTLTNVSVSSDNPGLTSSASGGGALSTISVDGTATFGGLVSASTAPTADEHLTNKAYVDAKAQTNADAIAAVVGGAPELLNTLDELAQALSDDENFATTVTNQIATETAARTAADTAEETARISADNTLQANIDAEEAARIAADATKLPLAGGTMTGAIQLGATANNSFTFTRQASGEKNVHVSFANSGYNNTIQIHSPLSTGSNGKLAISGSNNGLQYGNIVATHDGEVTTVTTQYQHIQITSLADDYTNDTLTITLMPGGHYETADFSTRTHVYADMTQYFHEPVLRTGTISSVSVPTSVLGVDGTATFGGNISASTAPTADAHLTNKLYVDGLTSANTANITTNTTNIAANTAAISAEEAARIAADALKLDLAGGQMSGDLEVGQGTGPNPSINVISAIGSVSDLTVSGASGGWTTAAASLAKTMANGGKHYFEVSLGANATGGWIGVTGEASDADIDISGPSNSYVEAVPFHDNTTHTKHLVSGSLYDGGSSTSNGVSAGAGDVLGVLVDASGDAPWTIGYTVNGVDAGSESIDYPWSDTYRPVLSIGAGDVTFRFNETDIEYLPTGYSAWVPTAPSVNLKTDGTASFAGNVTAALAPSSGDHLANKTYVDSSVSTANTNLTAAIAAEEAARIAADTTETNARIAADTTLTNDLAAEQSARIAADATKLPLAGGLMTGDLELGSAPPTTSSATFDTTFNNNWTYSNNDLTADNPGTDWKTTRIDTALPTSGKVYVELSRAGNGYFGLQQGIHTPTRAEDIFLTAADGAFGPGYAYQISNGRSYRSQGNYNEVSELAALDADDGTVRVYGLAIDIDANAAYMSINGSDFYELPNWFNTTNGEADAQNGYYGWFVGVTGPGEFTITLSSADWAHQPPSSDYQMIGAGAGGGALSTIAVDGTATFGGNVTAATAPTSGDHLTNKTYVDAKAQANADAIEAVVGGAPELLNTLNELAQAISDDEAFATTVTNQIAAETTARQASDVTLQSNIDAEAATRLANDNTLQANIDAEEAARIAADATKLPLAGGNMSGDIEMGQAAGLVDYDITSITSGVDQYNQPVAPSNLPRFFDGGDSNGFSIFPGQTLTFDPLVATTSVKLLAYTPTSKRPVTVELNGVAVHTYQDDGQHSGYSVDLSSSLTFPYTLTSVGTAAGSKELIVYGVEIDGVNVGPGYQTTSAGPASTIAVDGTATFGGNVTAALAPSSGDHLANKTYVDGEVTSANTALTAAIAAEEAARIAADTTETNARIAADNVLTTNLANEITNRQAGDALKLDLAGGTMSGDILMGGTQTVYLANNSTGFSAGDEAGWVAADTAESAPSVVSGNLRISGPRARKEYAVTAGLTYTIEANIDDGDSAWTKLSIKDGPSDDPFASTVAQTDYVFGSGFASFEVTPSGNVITLDLMNHGTTNQFVELQTLTISVPGSASASTIGVDGSATFSGLISAATAPTSGTHLTNKAYVDASSSTLQASIDAEAATRLANDNTLQANIDAEEAARIAADSAEATARADADTVLTNDLATETAARIAADATKLPLAGGTMSGDILFGGEAHRFTQAGLNTQISGDGLTLTAQYSSSNGYTGTAMAPNTGTYHFKFTSQSNKVDWGISRDRTSWDLTDAFDYAVRYSGTAVQAEGNDTSVTYSGVDFTGSTVKELIYNSDTQELSFVSGGNTFATITVAAQTYYFGVVIRLSAWTTLTLDPTSGKGAVSTVATDGTATFGGNVTAATAPTAAEHLTNKAYVDAKAQANADAIEAVVGGAPELLNTLDELAQALSDDENFATTVTNQIAAETTARTNADTVLTNDLATETAARIAADNTKLALAGGTMTGAINLGASADITVGPFTPAEGVSLYGSGEPTVTLTTGSGTIESITFVADGNNSEWFALYIDDVIVNDASLGQYVTGAGFNGNVGDRAFDSNASTKAQGASNSTMVFTPATPIPYTSKVQVKIGPYNTVTMVNGEAGGLSTLGVDGTATFAGNVTAATAPTAAGHLANKAYIDAVDSAKSADIAANAAAIAAEEAARIAADATKLPLAGGTMTGAIELGQVGTPLIQTQDFSADLTGGFDQPASNAFDGAVNVDGAPLARTTGNAVVVTLPINPAITVTESVTIYGETNYAPGLMNVSVTVDGVKTEANGVGNTHTFNVSGSLTEITVQNNGSGGRTYVDGFAVDGVLLADPGVTAPGGSAGPASTIAVDGTATFTDKVTVGSLEIDGALTDVNDATGNNGYILKSVGTGVEWIDILSILPQSRTTGNFTATAGQTVFTFTYNVGYLDVFVNGVKLSTDRGEFSADNGTTVTLTEALFAGDHVEMISFNTQGVGAGSVNSTADLTDVTLSGTTQNDILTYDGSKFVNGQTLNLSGAVTAQSFSGVGLELTGLNASELSTGTVSAARLGSGTADGTTFLRGDNTWAVVDSTTLKDSNNVTRVAATTSGATVTGDLDLGTGTLNAGDVVLTGNLIVNGTTTTLNTAELAVEDSNITVAKNATSGAEADGAGLTVAGANATLTYAAAGDRFAFNKSVAASTFIGDLLGNVTGNANTATALATPRTIGGVSFDGSANIDLPGVNTTGNQNTSGNAATATALQTARTIGGVSFDGSANINLPGVNTAGNQDTSGNAATATSASKVSLTNGSGTFYPALVPGGTGAKDVVSNTGLAFNTESGLLTVSGRVAAQDFNATSDITLKDNVSIIDNALEMINNLDGISWNWKNTGKASLGVSAQNVETVAPELVGQGEHKSVNYNGLVGVLIEAVKTLSAEVEMLKATKSDRRVRKSA